MGCPVIDGPLVSVGAGVGASVPCPLISGVGATVGVGCLGHENISGSLGVNR